jgi:hypothetical protein
MCIYFFTEIYAIFNFFCKNGVKIEGNNTHTNLNQMKKATLFMAAFAMLASCKKKSEEIVIEEKLSPDIELVVNGETEETQPLYQPSETYNFLGFGYDATDKFNNQASIRASVVDVEAYTASGDSVLLTQIGRKFNSEYSIESLACSYIDIYQANNTKECKEPLEVLYGKMNCGIHRSDIIELLVNNEVLDEKLKEEIKYDSYLDSRELIKTNL